MTTTGWDGMLRAVLEALGGLADPARLQVTGQGGWACRHPVTDLACASIGAASLMLARWIDPVDHVPVRLDRALASWWFGTTLRPEGWTLPQVRDAVTGDYATREGWIRIHANARPHRLRALSVLDLPMDASRAAVAQRVATWEAQALEDALVSRNACAAALRTPLDWCRHPQGLAVAAEPLVLVRPGAAAPPESPSIDPDRPLSALRVLDLTRVLAGPVATRYLAAHGARVLRLDPDDWEEPGMVPEVTVGKRCAALDLHGAAGRARFEALLARADVLVHGLRPGVLEALGWGEAERQALRPGLVDVSLDAWGWSGPWRMRRGFDSLVQMSTGIAWPGDAAARPDPLPVQALDQSAGYLMAACVLQGLGQRRERGRGSVWRVSLARMACLLAHARAAGEEPALGAPPKDAWAPEIELTDWGPARRLRAPARTGSADWSWDRPAGALRRDPPAWDDHSSSNPS